MAIIGLFISFFLQLGITTYTPEGLLVGAKSIVHQNRKLRMDMKDLEKELNNLRDQNEVMVSSISGSISILHVFVVVVVVFYSLSCTCM